MRGQQSYQNSAQAERWLAQKKKKSSSPIGCWEGVVVFERQREVVLRESRRPLRGQGCAGGGVKGLRREGEAGGGGVGDEQ